MNVVCEINVHGFENCDKTVGNNYHLPCLFCCKVASKTAVFIAFCTVLTTTSDVLDVCLVK